MTRQGFSSRLGFVLAAAGSAVGLGNIWGFPSEAANNGGGTFVFIYLIVLAVFALPALYAELKIGFDGRANPVKSMTLAYGRFHFAGKLLGYANLLGAIMMLSFYSILAGWMIAHSLAFLFALMPQQPLFDFLTTNSALRNGLFTISVLILTALMIVSGVQKGIEAWSKRLMPVLLLLMLGLIIFMSQQPGAAEGWQKFLVPDFSKGISRELILAAMGQAFFSLSVGVGGMMVYGSYLKQQENLPKLSGTIAGLDTLIAIMAGMLIIPALFVAQHYGATILQDDQLVSRSQLIFNVLPALFSQWQVSGMLIGLLFFSLLSIASLTSTISSTEVPVSYLLEQRGWSRTKSVIVISLVVGLCSSVIIWQFDWLFRTTITLLTHYLLPFMGLMYFIAVGWLNGPVKSDAGVLERALHLHIKYVCPVLMAIVIWHVA